MSRANIVATIRSLSEEPNKLSEDEETELYAYITDNPTKLDDVEFFLNLCGTKNAKLLYLKELSKSHELLRTVLPAPETLSIKTKFTINAATRKVPNKP
ncbi:25902_t:CDS:2, partial [Gigaspora margarita]